MSSVPSFDDRSSDLRKEAGNTSKNFQKTEDTVNDEDALKALQLLTQPPSWEKYIKNLLPILLLLNFALLVAGVGSYPWVTWVGPIPPSGTVPVSNGLWSYCSRDQSNNGKQTCSRITLDCLSYSCRTECLGTCETICKLRLIPYISNCTYYNTFKYFCLSISMFSGISGLVYAFACYREYNGKVGMLCAFIEMLAALLGIFPVTVFLRSVMDQDNHQFFKTGVGFYLFIFGWILSIGCSVATVLLFAPKFVVRKKKIAKIL
ncbi:uncharacterized protein LOC135121551 [Zophobas morio]|uniref:uncharacterized protein LOC135121551 n=1 Tax=Zophobas morio TaxID=2755281 RepID=UPI003082FF17